jgi:DNA primase
LTHDHLKTLKRYSDRLALCFDNDSAGRQAMERSIDLAHESDFDVRVLDIAKVAPGEKIKDPADLALARPGELEKAAEGAEPAMDYYFDIYLSPEADLRQRKNGLRNILNKIARLASPIEREQWLKKLGERSRVREETLLEEMRRLDQPETAEAREAGENPIEKLPREELISERILAIFTLDPGFRDELEKRREYLPSRYLEVYNCIVSGIKPADKDTARILDLITLRAGLEEKGKEELAGEFGDLLHHLEIEFLTKQAAKLGDLIREEEKKGEENPIEQIRQFQEIAARINQLKKDHGPSRKK